MDSRQRIDGPVTISDRDTIARRVDDDDVTRDSGRIEGSTLTAIGATFAERERAHDAVHRLHEEGFSQTWIGITRRDEASGYAADDDGGDDVAGTVKPLDNDTRVESANWFMRFFGEGDESLHDALVRHGISEADARAVGTLPADSAILTVEGGNHPELAAQIISEFGGQVISRGFGATGYGTAGSYSAAGSYGTAGLEGMASGAAGAYGSATGYRTEVDEAPESRSTSLLEDGVDRGRQFTPVAYDDYGRYRAGMSVDESTRLQLREERLRVDRSSIDDAEPFVTPFAASARDTGGSPIPVVREDVFVERQRGTDVAKDGGGSTSGSGVRAPGRRL